jgi:hypothetical protein
MGHPSVYPTGATSTIRSAPGAAIPFSRPPNTARLVDMNGNVVREWPELHGFQ